MDNSLIINIGFFKSVKEPFTLLSNSLQKCKEFLDTFIKFFTNGFLWLYGVVNIAESVA